MCVVCMAHANTTFIDYLRRLGTAWVKKVRVILSLPQHLAKTCVAVTLSDFWLLNRLGRAFFC